ncbi:hypothetical protein V1L54_00690 [Streptomyces sp. TRM 70361]|uniref:hypothetical protein n=1 Tax=Streptomyces sp. TRM 70361 TaxID=3116553 RepID=UPI002E7BCEDE|nr:hypothetical protein [Streptomyces sp. TRM 70361]MEE1937948.1 hypothetical protein [Streptomyces sp. TRM 70361]
MRRGLVHAGAWALATGAAVTLSWYGVHTVVSGTSYDRPHPLRVAGAPEVEPSTDSTRRPRPSASGGPARSPEPSRRPVSASTPDPSSSPSPSSGEEAGERGDAGKRAERPATPSAEVESHRVRGGRVAFDLGPDSATLVSATPNAGWEIGVWQGDRWIRVTFTRGDEASSVFCVWNGTPPQVTVDEHGG